MRRRRTERRWNAPGSATSAHAGVAAGGARRDRAVPSVGPVAAHNPAETTRCTSPPTARWRASPEIRRRRLRRAAGAAGNKRVWEGNATPGTTASRRKRRRRRSRSGGGRGGSLVRAVSHASPLFLGSHRGAEAAAGEFRVLEGCALHAPGASSASRTGCSPRTCSVCSRSSFTAARAARGSEGVHSSAPGWLSG